MNSRRIAITAIAVAITLVSFARPVLGAVRTTSSGTFLDSDGQKQQWEINDNHALIWNGRPYTPIGTVFQSKFLSTEPTDDNWQADVATLRQMKKAGVTQILLQPGGPSGTLDDMPSGTIQGLLDVLDSSGFTYGIDLSGSSGSAWTAALINPAVYRSPAPAQGSTVTFRNVPDIVAADYFLVSSSDSRVIARGSATVLDKETVSVTLPAGLGGDGTVLLLYPQARMSPDGVEGRRAPDIWSEGDSYRDALLLYLNRIRFGKGFRFFLDPLQVGSALFTEADGGILPVSENFRIQFQAWLVKKYSGSLVQLRASWGIKNNDITDYAVGARCEPLWFQSRGIALLMDPVTSRTYEVLPASSHYWQDVHDFETSAVQRAMNGVADALKQGVANVPVLYTWSKLSPVFVNQGPGGFDGLCVSANGRGGDIVQNGAGDAFGTLEQSRRTQWFVARLGIVPAASVGTAVISGVDAGRAALTKDRAAVESVGAKAVFVDAPSADDPSAGDGTWLKWVRADAASRTVDADSFASSKPRVIFYPVNIPLTHPEVAALAQGVWWLPTFQKGEEAGLGRKLNGYSLANSAGIKTYVVWSADGSLTEAKFRIPKGTDVDVRDPSGQPVAFNQGKDLTTITFGPDPRLISNLTDLPLPDGAVTDEIKEATRLINLGIKSKVPVDTYAQRLFYINNTIVSSKNVDPGPTYSMVRTIVSQLQEVLLPYTWVEGEAASQQSFESVVSSPDASGKSFLWVDTLRDPPGGTSGSFYAMYKMIVNAPGEYAIWAAIAPGAPGSSTTSPLVVRVDEQPSMDVVRPIVAGDRYGTLPFPSAPAGGAFTWCNLGSAQLNAGPHKVLISLTGRASGTNRYTLGLDAVVLTRAPFTPHGTDKPKF
ncbi:MAG: hypothetical protein P4L33_18405 [Capsulimonadaceae bacterium]|nr:hypothetical protein [Capsulimonadaceae bacterium]